MTKDLPNRKAARLEKFDYSTPGAYFITVCTKDRRCLLWENVGATSGRPHDAVLSTVGQAVDRAIAGISTHYPAITVDKYAVMPNHIHILLRISSDKYGRPMVAPTISTVIQQMKGATSKQAGFPLWQKGFHDHIVRGYTDYREIWKYIDENPLKWNQDILFQGE